MKKIFPHNISVYKCSILFMKPLFVEIRSEFKSFGILVRILEVFCCHMQFQLEHYETELVFAHSYLNI